MTKNTDTSTDKNTDKRLKNLKPPFKKGESGNPSGRRKGTKNFNTLYREALVKIAQAQKIDPDMLEIEIVEQALRKARNGDMRFYKDTMDRLHGTAPQHIDHTTKGEKLPTPITHVRRDNSDK